MINKSLIGFCLLLLISTTGFSQFYTGLRLGYAYSNQFVTVNTGTTYSGRSTSSSVYLGNGRSGLDFGMYGGYFFDNIWCLQTEFEFIPTGTRFEDDPSFNFNINYLQWNPVLLRVFPGDPEETYYYGITGFGLGFPVYSRFNCPGSQFPNPYDPFEVIKIDYVPLNNYVNSPNVSFILGAGLSIPAGNGKIEFEARYYGGLSDIYNADFKNDFLGVNIPVKSVVLSLRGGYILYLKKPATKGAYF